MHGGRERRFSSTPSQFMLTDDTNTNTSTSIESACLPIGCSVSAKYRGAFCSGKFNEKENDQFHFLLSNLKLKSKQLKDKLN